MRAMQSLTNILAAAGVSTVISRESFSHYGESLAGVRAETHYTQFDVPVDPYRAPGDLSSGLLFGISPEPFGQPGSGDKHLAAYSYRLPLTDVEENRLPIYKPDGYDPSHYELHRRYLQAGGKLYIPRLKGIPNRKTDLIGSEAVLATDLLGMNDDWPAVGSQERQNILDKTATFTKGLIWFFANGPAVPLDIRNEWSRFGYCLDEFPDNNHFPRQLYVRDARRMVSDYVITQHTASEHDGEEEDPYPVAIAYWSTNTHWAVRIEHQFWELGQACANACDIALSDTTAPMPVQDVPYGLLRERLLSQNAVLDVALVGKPDFSLLGPNPKA
ncbi:hypothetical protein P170DRAFT_426076 [Aspergillus steynii IBT 23096]|uniref:Uncharacterized protein n=1 Tax=Aspergillus steynii IBT 23096 TaxID=1392250 RepID=A0A2I2G8D3_9EURO|nr:uncharacterized protein P170DRAFT_426076 [Aspergillus steynii IBT 23096]PLB49103.1 hypothetical protein P170DRAFT_426076 [Aspergillus steynii IBT 23096]